jgi:hypothetical protein
LRWLNNVTRLVKVSVLFFGQQGLGHFSGLNTCFPLAGRLCKFYANTKGKRPIQRQPLLAQNKQQTNLLLSLHNYNPLVISGNDKNKQLTLSSQRKLAITGRNMEMAL